MNLLDSMSGGWFSRVEAKIDQLLKGESVMAVDLTALKNAVAAETSVNQSAITLLQGLSAQIAALSQQPTVNPADLQALADSINVNAKALSDAVTANTPVAPVVPPPAPPGP